MTDDVVILRGAADFGDDDLRALLDAIDPVVLDLSDTGVTDEGVAELAGLQRLAYLRLAGTGLTDAGLRKLGAIPGLMHLDASRTHVSGSGFDEWPDHRWLESLWMEETSLTDESLHRFIDRAYGMSLLSVARTEVTDAAFSDNPVIRILNLSGTQITADSLASLGLNKRDQAYGYLVWLDVSDTAIQPDELAEIVPLNRYWLELQPRPTPEAENRWVEASLLIRAEAYGESTPRISSSQRRQSRLQLNAARQLVSLHLTADLVGTPMSDLEPLISQASGDERSVNLFGWSEEGFAEMGVLSEGESGLTTSVMFYAPEW